MRTVARVALFALLIAALPFTANAQALRGGSGGGGAPAGAPAGGGGGHFGGVGGGGRAPSFHAAGPRFGGSRISGPRGFTRPGGIARRGNFAPRIGRPGIGRRHFAIPNRAAGRRFVAPRRGTARIGRLRTAPGRLQGTARTRAGRLATRALVDPRAARQGVFAARTRNGQFGRGSRWRGTPLAPRQAWRHHRRGGYVPWYGGIYWPYFYSDFFDYTFWPYAYDDDYWAYAYDDFFGGIFFPYGAPYETFAYAGPYGRVTSRTRSALVTTTISKTAQQLCSDPGSGVTAWPFERIDKSVKPNQDQQALLGDLKTAAANAADRFKQACPTDVPLTPPGRLQIMTERLQAALDAVKIVRPPLEKFYDSLGDEQKARFNAIGPSIGKNRTLAADNASCSNDKAGLTTFPIQRMDEVLKPTEAQKKGLDTLSDAMRKAVDALQAACPNYVPRTPVGRLEVMQKRLEAMIAAANTVRPPLDDFYASLTDEQKAQFNLLGGAEARSRRSSAVRHDGPRLAAEHMIRRVMRRFAGFP